MKLQKTQSRFAIFLKNISVIGRWSVGNVLIIYGIKVAGVQQMAAIYRCLIEKHNIDGVVLADGGADSLIFG